VRTRCRGLGGRSKATISVVPGDEIQIMVGGQGDDPDGDGAGGFNGGGGGGSGLCPSTCDQVDQGVRDGDGLVTVTYDEPSPTTTAVTVQPAATPATAVAARPRFTG
jgi:hypothetical protein